MIEPATSACAVLMIATWHAERRCEWARNTKRLVSDQACCQKGIIFWRVGQRLSWRTILHLQLMDMDRCEQGVWCHDRDFEFLLPLGSAFDLVVLVRA